MATFEQVKIALKENWGFDNFRPAQSRIIQELLANQSVIGILPTGGGKSLCFQVPGLVFEGITLVISPLISLIDDQVSHLSKKNISAIALHSRLSQKEYFQEVDNLINGKYKFVYISPEKLMSEHFISIISAVHVSQVAIDEAHCISMWGFDFRPSYRKIGDMRDLFPDAYWIALTASATNLVIKDIQQELKLTNTKVKRVSLSRKNLRYAVFYEESISAKLLNLCNRISGSGLIYTRSRKETVEIDRLLKANEMSSDHYHAGLSIDERSAKQNSWMKGETRIMVCTSAFGMGIDKPNVRFVLHAEPPENLAYYYQEAGRAGRDGNTAYVGLFYNKEHVTRLENRFANKQISRKELGQIYDEFYSYFQIAVGMGEGLTFPFNAKALVSSSALSATKWHAAIDILRMHELFTLAQDIKSQSSIRILNDTSKNSSFELEHEYLNKVLKTIVRKYAGVYNGPTKIDESFIAEETSLPKRAIVQYLQRLEEMQIVEYQQQKDENVILFSVDRVNVFVPNMDKLNMFAEQLKVGHEGIIKYIHDHIECRNEMISIYFGVKQGIPCGVCDNCKKLKKSKSYAHQFSKISLELKRMVNINNKRESLLQELKNKPMHTLVLQELIERKIVRKDKGSIYWNENSK